MTPLQDVISHLGSASLTAEKISSNFRALGFRASTVGLRQVLIVSSALAPHFHALEQHFPNAKKILADFQLSNEILNALDKLPELGARYANRKSKLRRSGPFCEAITSKDYKPINFDQHPAIGEIIAFFWLLHNSISAFPGTDVSPKLARLLYASVYIVRSSWMVIEDNPQFGTSWRASLKDDLTDWFSEASNAIDQASVSNLSLSIPIQDIKAGFQEARELIDQLPDTQNNNEREIDVSIEPQCSSGRFSDQRGAGLYERERLSCHPNAFQDAEIESLAKVLRGILEQNLNSDYLRYREIDLVPPSFRFPGGLPS